MEHEPINDQDDGDLRAIVRSLVSKVDDIADGMADQNEKLDALKSDTAGIVEAWQNAGKMIGFIKWTGNLVKWLALVTAPILTVWMIVRGKFP